ncbi:hypothetical protein F5Y09DRAFT_296374 [Xylaria sp. FL1042]|nr:hypothetical protein F5Y09DRAFT_296374 [Xylaria sp. FL1042]
MATSLLSLFLSLLIITPALTAVPRPDHATLLLPFDAGLAPRWYMEGTPAVPAQQPVSPNPRHMLRDSAIAAAAAAARQVNICDPGYHSCVEANAPGTCCPNDRYCYLDEDWIAKCCSLGVKCQDSKCMADELYCNTTSSTTVPVTTTIASSTGRAAAAEKKDTITTVTSLVSLTTFAACCNRACSASMFSCEKAFGGQCCSYGFKCATSSNCIADPAPATNTGGSTVAPEVPPGCTTSQFACAESDGGGCCNTGSICTSQTLGATTSQVCAPLSDGGSYSSGGLSSGAKAGIGVGVAVAAAIIISAITWLCIRRRRRSGTTGTNASANEMRQSAGVAGDEDAGNSLLVGPPQTPWTPSSAFTDGRELAGSPLHGRVCSDHFPNAVAAPYMDRQSDGHVAPNPSLATTPPAGSMPYDPDDILRRAGMGAAEKEAGMGKESRRLDEMPGRDEDLTVGRFELMGSLGSSSPLNPNGESQPMDKGPK